MVQLDEGGYVMRNGTQCVGSCALRRLDFASSANQILVLVTLYRRKTFFLLFVSDFRLLDHYHCPAVAATMTEMQLI